MDLSVLIVNWNTGDLLQTCLRSLEGSLAKSALESEILVVDNASADQSAEMVRAEFPAIRLLANEENRNYAAGSNQGLAAARGEFILLLNPDTEVPPGVPEYLVKKLRAEPGWGALAPALVHPDGAVQESVRGFPTPKALFGAFSGAALLSPQSEWGAYRVRAVPHDRISLVDQPMASALLLRRAALDQVGRFDEAFPLFFNDVDLCYRLKQAGWAIAYDPRVRVVHHGGASTSQVRPEAILLSHKGLEQFYDKHYRGRIGPAVYALLIWVIRMMGEVRAALAAARERR